MGCYLVQEGHVDEAVVEHQGLLCTEQFSEQCPDVNSLVISSSLTGRKEEDQPKTDGNNCYRFNGMRMTENVAPSSQTKDAGS